MRKIFQFPITFIFKKLSYFLLLMKGSETFEVLDCRGFAMQWMLIKMFTCSLRCKANKIYLNIFSGVSRYTLAKFSILVKFDI